MMSWNAKPARSLAAAMLTLGLAVAGCQGCQGDLAGNTNQVAPDDAGTDATSDARPDDAGECPGEQHACGGACCAADQLCVDGQCGGTSCDGTRCGPDRNRCCEGDTICFGDGCATPGEDCERTEDCETGEICEPSVGSCMPRENIPECTFTADTEEFEPEVGCKWVSDNLETRPDRGDIVAAPVVANLTDDNGDGTIDTEDTPDIAFPSFNRSTQGCCNADSTLRVLDGECRDDGTYETIASITGPSIANDSGIAVGNLDGEDGPEIVGVTNNNGNPQGMVAYRSTSDDGTSWELMWQNDQYPTNGVHTQGAAQASIADLEGDGEPEVIVGNVVLNGQDGTLKWDGNQTSGGSGGIGNNSFVGPASTVADIDHDDEQEVIAGNTVYHPDGEVDWTYDYESASSSCGGSLPCDGYNGVADFTPDDDFANVVSIRRGDIYVIDHEGELVWKQQIPRAGCSENESGPPTIADFDGDGRPEIGTAGADYYVVAKKGCDVDDWEDRGCEERGILWKTTNDDCSSRATASSVFDFQGDGRAEVVYADETSFQVYDGTTGNELFTDGRHESNTRVEMPIIADVNNNEHAQVLVPTAYGNRNQGQPGLWAWSDSQGQWVRSRRIWNQHAYSITNVEEDGTIPADPDRNWEQSRFNNFRQNVEPAGLFDAPDLTVRDLEAANAPATCGPDGFLDVRFTVANTGALSVPGNLAVDVRLVADGDVVEEKRLHTSDRLLPGHFEDFDVDLEIDDGLIGVDLQLIVEIDPEDGQAECDYENNEVTVEDLVCDIQG